MTARFDGVFAVLPTPFHMDGTVDELSLRRVVRLYAAADVDGLTALGVTSEVAHLTDDERLTVLRTVMSEIGDTLPVVVGVSAQEVSQSLRYAALARDFGAAAVMISPPRMAMLDADAVTRFFASVAAAQLPIIVQDYPTVTGYSMTPALLVRLLRDVVGVQAIKLEDPPTAPKIAAVLREGAPRAVRLFGGLGGVYLLEELLAGATGCMTGFAFPEGLVEIVRLYRCGQVERAADLFYRLVPLLRLEFQSHVGIAIRKELLRRRGALSTAIVRVPGGALDSESIQSIDQMISWYKREGSLAEILKLQNA